MNNGLSLQKIVLKLKNKKFKYMQDLANSKIIIKSPAKINLHLEVIGKREDGFHELAMIMQNIDLSDYLEFQINNEGLIKLESDCNDLSLSSDNLIVKSANLLRKQSNIDFGANIFLRKNIPIGAGLAGGSSNAAATLIGLNKLWDLNLDQETLCSLASNLGSDIPFFIDGGIQLCFGRGEILEKLDSNFGYGVILLKNPNVSVSTAETYKKYSNRFCDKYFNNKEKIENIRKNLRDNVLKNLSFDNKHITIKNDLQLVVENDNDSVKQSLYLLSKLKNCLTFSMSGSGPTCFALFKDIETAKKELSANYKLFKDKGYDSWVCTFLEKGIAFMEIFLRNIILADNNNENIENNIPEKGPLNFIVGSLTSFLLFIFFYFLSNKIAIYFSIHKPSNSSEIVQNISSSINTLIIGLSFLLTFSFAFIGIGLFIVFIRSFFLKKN